jgi:hypothetical protein
VRVNRRPALRIDDPGIHAACCGANTWTATTGSLTVFINGKGAHRMGDQERHCGGMGRLVEGSPNVIVGESGGAGAAVGPRRAAADPAGAGAAAGGQVGADGSRAAGGGSDNIDRGPPGAVRDAIRPGDSHEDPPGSGSISNDQIEIELVFASGAPAARVDFVLTFPDGSERTGKSGRDGVIRFSGLSQRGECELELPSVPKAET